MDKPQSQNEKDRLLTVFQKQFGIWLLKGVLQKEIFLEMEGLQFQTMCAALK